MGRRDSILRIALELAGTQHGVAARHQLIARGVPPRTIASAVDRARLFTIYPGVYLVGRPQLSEQALLVASLLAAGEGSALDGRTAAAIWGFHRHRNPVEVSNPGVVKNRRALIRIEGESWWPYLLAHQSDPRSEGEVTFKRGIALTTPARTLQDCAARLGKQQFRRAFMEADRLELLDDRALAASASRSQGRKGGGLFKAMVYRRIPNIKEARSILEGLVLDLVETNQVPAPEINRKTHQYRPDFRWQDQGVLVEADGYEFHRGKEAFENDTLRQNRLRAEGWQVLRFTWRMVTEDPEEVAANIRMAIGETTSRNPK